MFTTSTETNRQGLTAPAQLAVLFQMQLANWRWASVQIVTTCLVVPMLSILGMGIFGRTISANVVAYILVGNVVIAVLFGNLANVGTNIAYMKLTGMITYFRMLPVYAFALILATCAAFSVLALPAIVLTVLFGSSYLRVPLSVSPQLLWVVPLCCIPMGCIGAVIGIKARSFPESSALNFFVTTVMTVSGSIVVAPELLPPWLTAVGWVNPANYAAILFRWALLGFDEAHLLLASVVLLALSALGACVVARPMMRE